MTNATYLRFEIQKLRSQAEIATDPTTKARFTGMLNAAENIYNAVNNGQDAADAAMAFSERLYHRFEETFTKIDRIKGGDNDSVQDMADKLYQENLTIATYIGADNWINSEYGFSANPKG